jgi:hypothetical protein
MVCTKCGTIGADVRPNWLEKANQAPESVRSSADFRPTSAAASTQRQGHKDAEDERIEQAVRQTNDRLHGRTADSGSHQKLGTRCR